MWKFTYTEVFKRWVSFVGPSVPLKHSPWCLLSNLWGLDNLTVFAASPHTNWKRRGCHKTHPKRCNIFHFHWFFYPLCRHPWLSAWWSLPNQVIAFIISKRVIAQHLFQIVHCISVDKTQQHQRLQNPNWVWGKKKWGDEFNGWPRINSANYASAWTCFRSNLLTIIIFSISATVVELNGKLFWIPL